MTSAETSAGQNSLRADALAIWQAGVAAVDAERLVRKNVRVVGRTLHIGDDAIELDCVRRILVVGAGKAGTGMVAGLQQALGPALLRELDVVGWVNVPADTVPPEHNASQARIRLHAARPAGMNEPTIAGVQGAAEILRLVGEAHADDVCICLISGGGSALAPAPAEGISLQDKVAITRMLSASGANIEQLNTVRIALSRIKGGGLARACRAGRMFTLVISDVLGDPLELIASGPTAPSQFGRSAALDVLDDLQLPQDEDNVLPRIQEFLTAQATNTSAEQPAACEVRNIVIGNLAVAADAAGLEAERRGYEFAMHIARQMEGEANALGQLFANLAWKLRRDASVPNCLIHGGEPVVTLTGRPGTGGRNQQLVLAAYVELLSLLANEPAANKDSADSAINAGSLDNFVILSAGTDGEDGPTDAAGALIDGEVHRAALAQQLNAAEFLVRNDAYHFFAPTGGLIKTGPTGTNVCDLRVIIARRQRC